MREPEIILLIESTAESVKRDMFTVVSFWLLILPGWWIGSNAAQWIGGMLFAVALLGRISSAHKNLRMSLPAARARLDALAATHPTQDRSDE